MTAVPPCPHYLVTLFLSKVIFPPRSSSFLLLIFLPPQTAPGVVHKWIWNFFSDPHPAHPHLFPLCLLDFSSIFISLLQKLFSLLAIPYLWSLTVVLDFFSAELSFWPETIQSWYLPFLSFPLRISPYVLNIQQRKHSPCAKRQT